MVFCVLVEEGPSIPYFLSFRVSSLSNFLVIEVVDYLEKRALNQIDGLGY